MQNGLLRQEDDALTTTLLPAAQETEAAAPQEPLPMRIPTAPRRMQFSVYRLRTKSGPARRQTALRLNCRIRNTNYRITAITAKARMVNRVCTEIAPEM